MTATARAGVQVDAFDAMPGAVVGVVGAPRSGKTYALQAAARSGVLGRYVVFDPYASRDRRLAEIGQCENPWPGRLVTPEDLYLDVVMDGGILEDASLDLVVAPTSLEEQHLARDFGRIARLCWAAGHISLVCEEVGLYGRSAAPIFNRISSGGGHAELRLFCAVQSISRMASDLRRHLSRLVVFRQSDPRDLEWLRKGYDKDVADAAASLKCGDAPLVL